MEDNMLLDMLVSERAAEASAEKRNRIIKIAARVATVGVIVGTLAYVSHKIKHPSTTETTN